MPLYELENVDTPVMAQFSLKGKIAVVTGGSRGIGLQVVTGLAEAGADVAIIYVDTPEADAIAKQIASKTGSRVAAYEMDVTDRKGLRDTIENIARDFGHGRLDIVVANAGVCAEVPSLKYDEKSWRFINSVNYDGVMWTALAAGGIFRRQGRGNLIITASISATVVNLPQRQAAYNASKAAVVQLGKTLAVEWADFARVNCISPGYVLTEMVLKQPSEYLKTWTSMVPGGRLCKPAELKGIYTFMASDASCYMTGANINVDGGLSLP